MMASGEAHGPAIGGWELARNVSEWIEIGAILVIAVTVVAAVAQMSRTVLAGEWASANDVFKRIFSRAFCSASTC